MHQLRLLEHMDYGEEGFLFLRQVWRRNTGEEPVSTAHMWKRESLDRGYHIGTLAFLIVFFIGTCVILAIMIRKGFTISDMNTQVLITVMLLILALGTRIVIRLIKHLLGRRSAFGTAIEDLADALKVDVEVLKFIQKEAFDQLVEKFHSQGAERLKESQAFEARGVKETIYSLGYKRYLKHRPTVEKFKVIEK